MKLSKTSRLALVSRLIPVPQLVLVSRLFLVSFTGLAAAALLTGCQLVTVDYVYVASSSGSSAGSAGQIQTYAVDSESGALRSAGTPTVPSGGTDPVAMAVTANYYHLYVANQGNSSVVHFSISDVGVLTQKDSITTAQPPVYLAVNQANTYLYVISGTTSATLTEYALNTDGVIGSAVAQETLTLPSPYSTDTMVPTGVATLPTSSSSLTVTADAVYVTAYDQSAYNPGGITTSTANPGWVFGFAVDSSGALTPTTDSPYQAGVKPTAIIAEPASRFIYVTDFASNELIGYTIENDDVLSFMVDGPFKTGNEPESIVVDPRGSYIYLVNQLDNTVSGYTINLPTGSPSALVSSNSSLYATDTEPVSLTLEPALGRFVYTANHLGNSISGFRLNPNTGAMTATVSGPYPTGADPTAIVSVPHGNHSTESITP
ncbi:MAG: lactonase family protein [Terracidiphilus sp.]